MVPITSDSWQRVAPRPSFVNLIRSNIIISLFHVTISVPYSLCAVLEVVLVQHDIFPFFIVFYSFDWGIRSKHGFIIMRGDRRFTNSCPWNKCKQRLPVEQTAGKWFVMLGQIWSQLENNIYCEAEIQPLRNSPVSCLG